MIPPLRYFDDFTIGEKFETAPATLSESDTIAFAERYDPQPFHLDAGAARESVFRDLTASGWQTAAMTMRSVVDTGILRATGIIGTGIDELRWFAPVKPGDRLRIRPNSAPTRCINVSSRIAGQSGSRREHCVHRLCKLVYAK